MPIASSASPRPGRARLPIRSVSVIGLLLLLLVLISVLASLHIWRGYTEAIRLGETRVLSAAQTAAAHVRWLMEANRQALARVDAGLSVEDGQLLPAAPDEFAAIMATLPQKADVWVFDATGEPVLTSASATGTNVSDRDYFRELRNGQDWLVSRLLIGRATGRKIFVIGRRIERGGRFLGAAISVLPIEVMGDFWSSLDLGPGSSVGLIREDGWLVVRYPAPDDTLNLSGYVLFTELLPVAPSGVYDAVSPADDVARIVGYTRVEGLPLVAVVGIGRDWALARFRKSATAVAFVAVPLAVTLVGLTGWVAVLLRRDEEARRRDEEMRARLSEALEHNRMLVREAYHRVKNNLQAVSAMLQLGPGDAETKAEMSRRIAAMAALHEQLYTSDQFEVVRLDEHISGTVDRLREAHPDGAGIVCDLDPLEVAADKALPVALIVSEVVSNALKHAFSDAQKGTIRITLRREGAGRAVVTVADDGVGFSPDGARRGLGLRLVRAFAQQVGGEAGYRADGGTRFTLEFPL